MAKVLKLTHETKTGRGVAVAENGLAFQFFLQREEKWNVGLRRHTSELNGKIVGINPLTRGQTVCSDWTDFYTWVEDQSRRIASADAAPKADNLPEDWL